MKKHLLPFIFCLLLPFLNGLHAQCLPDGITFASQAQIDSFPMNYPGCTVIEGSVTIMEVVDGDILSLDSLYPISLIEGDLWVGNPNPFTDGNSGLEDLRGLEGLTNIGGDLLVSDNASLESLDGLDNLTSIGNSIFIGYNDIDHGIYGNPSLISINALNNITDIPGGLHVYGSVSLTSLNGLTQLQSVGGNLILGANNSLISLNGLDSLTLVGGDLHIGWEDGWTFAPNPFLANLNGLKALTIVGGDLTIFGSEKLINLTGLDNLTSISGDLMMTYNDSLMSLSGLGNLDHLTIQYLLIRDNPNLSICDIQPICDFLENGGPANIENNAPGCNSVPEVEDACLTVFVDDLILEDAIQLFPNPTSGLIQVSTFDNSEWKVVVRDATGTLIISNQQLLNGQIDLSNVPTGLYLLELNNGQQTIIKRIVKQ